MKTRTIFSIDSNRLNYDLCKIISEEQLYLDDSLFQIVRRHGNQLKLKYISEQNYHIYAPLPDAVKKVLQEQETSCHVVLRKNVAGDLSVMLMLQQKNQQMAFYPFTGFQQLLTLNPPKLPEACLKLTEYELPYGADKWRLGKLENQQNQTLFYALPKQQKSEQRFPKWVKQKRAPFTWDSLHAFCYKIDIPPKASLKATKNRLNRRRHPS